MMLRFDEIFSALLHRDLPSFKAIWGQESCNTSMVLSPEDQPVDAAAMSSLKFRIYKISQNIFKNYRFSCLFWLRQKKM